LEIKIKSSIEKLTVELKHLIEEYKLWLEGQGENNYFIEGIEFSKLKCYLLKEDCRNKFEDFLEKKAEREKEDSEKMSRILEEEKQNDLEFIKIRLNNEKINAGRLLKMPNDSFMVQDGIEEL